jgi:hypothetical protein
MHAINKKATKQHLRHTSFHTSTPKHAQGNTKQQNKLSNNKSTNKKQNEHKKQSGMHALKAAKSRRTRSAEMKQHKMARNTKYQKMEENDKFLPSVAEMSNCLVAPST